MFVSEPTGAIWRSVASYLSSRGIRIVSRLPAENPRSQEVPQASCQDRYHRRLDPGRDGSRSSGGTVPSVHDGTTVAEPVSAQTA